MDRFSKALVQNLMVPVLVLDPKLEVIYYNKAFNNQFLITHKMGLRVSGFLRENFNSVYQVLQDETFSQGSLMIPYLLGTQPYELEVIPRGTRSEVKEIYIIFHEEEGHKQKEASSKMEQFAFLTEKLPLMVCFIDEEGKILRHNQKFQDIFPFTKLGEKLIYLIQRNYYGVYKGFMYGVEQRGSAFCDGVVLLNQKVNAVDIYGIQVQEGENPVYGMVLVDSSDKIWARKQVQNYFMALKNSLESIVIYDKEGYISFWNKASEILYGYQEEEVLGKRIHEVMHRGGDEEVLNELIQHVLRGNSISHFEFCDFAKDGSPKYTLCTQTPMYNVFGEVEQIVSSQMDITQIRSSEKNLGILYYIGSKLAEERNLKELCTMALKETIRRLRLVSGVIYTVDEVDEILEQVSTYSRIPELQLFEDKKILDIGKGISGVVAQTKKSILVDEPELHHEFSQEFKQKLDGRGAISIPLVNKDQLLGIMTLIKDRTHVVTQNERQILESIGKQIGVALENALLLEELRHKTSDLQKQNALAQEANRLKSEFLANMSHELKTPLNAIIGFSDILMDGLDGDLNDKQMKDLERIRSNGAHLLRLINDVLDLSKIDSNKMIANMSETDIYPLLLQTVSNVESLIQKKNITLHMNISSTLPLVEADEMKLSQVLLNVISNAVKFTDMGSIYVGAELDELGEYLVVKVKDTGIGIRKKDYKKIFEPFIQVDMSITRTQGGTGLGMAISKKYMEMMAGDIWFTSQYRKGSTFFIKIPIAQ